MLDRYCLGRCVRNNAAFAVAPKQHIPVLVYSILNKPDPTRASKPLNVSHAESNYVTDIQSVDLVVHMLDYWKVLPDHTEDVAIDRNALRAS
jgi:hypothetical protein